MATPLAPAGQVPDTTTTGDPLTSEARHTTTNTAADDLEKDKGDTSTSPADTIGEAADGYYDEAAEMDRRSSVIQALARSYSRASGVEGGNPFFAGPDSPLNPQSDNFDGKKWARAIVDLVQQSGSDFRTSGIAFQHLNVHGFGAGSDYQKDVGNVWLSLAGMAGRLAGAGRGQRIDILQDFDGIVHNGEMLVVLGPPGSGCSTFLKTIAGEMNGIYTDDQSYFNYQGESGSTCLSEPRPPNLLHPPNVSRRVPPAGLSLPPRGTTVPHCRHQGPVSP